MISSRLCTLMLASAVATIATAQTVEPRAFTVLRQDGDGKPVVFQSTRELKKGDVIQVSAVNAQPVMVLQMAMCDTDCSHMRLVKSLPLTAYYAGAATNNQRFVVPEKGYVSFWVQQLGGVASTPLNAPNGMWTLQYVDPFLTFASQTPVVTAQPTPANALSVTDNKLQARFYHRTFLTVSLADTNG